MLHRSPPVLPEDFAPPLADCPDPNPDGREAVLRGLIFAGGASAVLWLAMFLAWRSWGWWGPPAVLLAGAVGLVALALAFRHRGG